MEKPTCYLPVAIRTEWPLLPDSEEAVWCGGRCCLLSFSSWTLPLPSSLTRAEAGFLDLPALPPSLPPQKSVGEGLWGREMTRPGWGSSRADVSATVGKSPLLYKNRDVLDPDSSPGQWSSKGPTRHHERDVDLSWRGVFFIFLCQDRRRWGISSSCLGLFCLEILFCPLVDQGSQNFMWEEKKVPEGFQHPLCKWARKAGCGQPPEVKGHTPQLSS